MKKLSFLLVALLTIIFAVSSTSSSKLQNTTYKVYGIVNIAECLTDPSQWHRYVIEEKVEATENPTTSEPSPFTEEQNLSDFAQTCTTNPNRVCLILVKLVDNVITEVLAVTCGEFQGW